MNSLLLLGLHSRHPITQTSSSPGPEWSTDLPPGHCLLPGCDLILCLFSPEHPPRHSTAVPAYPKGSGLAFLGEFSQLCRILPVNQSHSGHGMAFALLNSSRKWPTAWTSSDQAAGSGWISGAGAASSPSTMALSYFSREKHPLWLLRQALHCCPRGAGTARGQAQATWRSLAYNSSFLPFQRPLLPRPLSPLSFCWMEHSHGLDIS